MTDDLKKISGIGTAVAKRLADAGIELFEQLAADTAENVLTVLSGVRGISLARVMTWQKKAAALARDEATNRDENGQHYAKFVVTLLLDKQNRVRRTQLVAVADEQMASWAGWQPTEMAQMMASLAGLSEAGNEQVAMKLMDWRLMGEASSRRLLPAKRPFAVQLQLQADDEAAAQHCVATIYAKRLATGERKRLGEAAARLQHSAPTLLKISTASLPEGDYRLEAEVKLLGEMVGVETAVLQGGLFQMY